MGVTPIAPIPRPLTGLQRFERELRRMDRRHRWRELWDVFPVVSVGAGAVAIMALVASGNA